MEEKPQSSEGDSKGQKDPEPKPEGVTARQDPQESTPHGPDGEALLQGSHRLMEEITEEGRRVRTAFFLGTCLFLIVGALLILVAVFYLKLAVKQMEGRLDLAATNIADRFENRINGLFEEKERQDGALAIQIREMENRTADLVTKEHKIRELEKQLQEVREDGANARFELRRALESIDKQRRELDAKARLLDDTLALVEKERGRRTKADSKEAPGEADPRTAGAGEEKAAYSMSAALQGINRLMSDYTEEGVVIVGCDRIDGGVLRNPLIRSENFLKEGPAVLSPDLAVFSLKEGFMELKGYGGSYSRPQAKSEPFPAGGVSITRFSIASDAKVLTVFLREILGLSDDRHTTGGETLADAVDPGTAIGALKILNDLLEKERGGKYRLRSIGAIEGDLLIDVEMEKFDASGEVENVIRARTCGISLVKRDRYVEFLFKGGFFVTGDQEKPFYNDVYRLPIPNANNELWEKSGLRFLKID